MMLKYRYRPVYFKNHNTSNYFIFHIGYVRFLAALSEFQLDVKFTNFSIQDYF